MLDGVGKGSLGRQMPGEPAHLALMPLASISLNKACIHRERARVNGPHLKKVTFTFLKSNKSNKSKIIFLND